MAAAVAQAQQAGARPEPARNQANQAYIVPFSHLDLFWAGTREEDLARGNRIIAKALRIALAHPDFRFFIESDNFLANYVASHRGSPDLADLRRLVQQGRIEIAPNWAGIFLNMPDGEVLARNLLYGALYARTRFGVVPRVLSPTDIPGFPAQYPQVLREAGIPFMFMTRMGPTGISLFDWRAPQGSQVLVWTRRGYGWGIHLNLHGDLDAERLQTIRRELAAARAIAPGPVLIYWGMDLWTPTPKLVENIGVLNAAIPQWHFQLATPQEFFQAVADTPDLETLSGAVPLGWPHVVDGIVQLWQPVVPATNTLEMAERFAAINYAAGYARYPGTDLDLLWKKLIESMDHNHDGQGGAIGDNRKFEDTQLAMIRGGEILRDSLRDIAERVQLAPGRSAPIVVFNGQSWRRDDVVSAHVTLFGDVIPADIADFKRGLRLLDAEGRPVPFAVEQTAENISRALDVVFVARSVPPLGYSTFYLVPAAQPPAFPPAAAVKLDRAEHASEPRRPRGFDTLENDFYRLTVDDATGDITVFDKQLDRDVIRDMRIEAAGERGSNNVQAEQNTGRIFPMLVTRTKLEENNAVRAVLDLSGFIGDVPVTQTLSLYRGLKRLDVADSLDWNSQGPIRIEQLFPIATAPIATAPVQAPDPRIEYGVAFGANSSTDVLPGSGPSAGDEIDERAWCQYRVIQGWVFAGVRPGAPAASGAGNRASASAADTGWGVTIAADHQLVRLEGRTIHAAMLRGQPYTSAKIVRGDEVTSIRYPMPGHYVFRYELQSGPGDWKTARAWQTGLGFNSPLMPVSVVDELSTKTLPASKSFASFAGNDVVISALKKAEEGDAIVMRLYEMQGSPARGPILFLGQPRTFHEMSLDEAVNNKAAQSTLTMKPYEIKTVALQH
jgi:hypothetical protein